MSDSTTSRWGLHEFNPKTKTWGTDTTLNWGIIDGLYLTGTDDPNTATQAAIVGQLYVRTGAEADIYQAQDTAAPSTWLSLLHDNRVYKKSQSGEYVSVVSAGGNVAFDFDLSNYFNITLTEDTQMDNPTNVPSAGSFIIAITQDAGTLRTVSWDTNYHFPGDTPPAAPQLGDTWMFNVVVDPTGKLRMSFIPD